VVPLVVIDFTLFQPICFKAGGGRGCRCCSAHDWFVLLMRNWRRGTSLSPTRHGGSTGGAARTLIARLEKNPPERRAGHGRFMTASPTTAPDRLLHNLKTTRAS